jgi:hypothetical protein
VRNISFALTTPQIRARTKTVTRRRGTWWAKILKPGDLLCAVEKSQGIKKGGLVRLGTIRVRGVWVVRLDYPIVNNLDAREQQDECAREGFPEMALFGEFVQMFQKHMGGRHDQAVTRIEFEYVS